MPAQFDSIVVVNIESDQRIVNEIDICLLNVRSLRVTKAGRMMVRNEDEFESACFTLQDVYHSDKRVWAGYGETTREIFQEQCEDLHVVYPFSENFFNIKVMFPIAFNLKHEVGLTKGIKMTKLEYEEPPNVGINAAVNSARILGEIIRGNAVY